MIHVHGRGEWQGEVHLYEKGGGGWRGMVREEGHGEGGGVGGAGGCQRK